MVNQSAEIDAITETINNYIQGTYQADVDLIKKAFHPDAVMTGYMMDQLLTGSTGPF